MNRDPFGAWPVARRWRWGVAATIVCLFWGPSFIQSLRPPQTIILDFFQEWTSARNLLSGLPVYMDLEKAAQIHLGMKRDPRVPWGVHVNAHPPSSVLLVIPIAWLDYPDAFLVWNLLSLAALGLSIWVVVRQLGIIFSAWSTLPVVALLLMCNPFRQQVNQGQLNLILLLLIVCMWAADRSGRPYWAGGLLGAATVIKLFPAFLFLYFALRRDWKTCSIGLVSATLITGATAVILGPDSFISYFTEVMPRVGQFRDWWANLSILGFWSRLFDAESGHVIPLIQLPTLALAGWFSTTTMLLAVWAWVVWHSQSRLESDLAFGLSLIVMLLASPIAWDHYFLLLLIPLALIWFWRAPVPRFLLGLIALSMWVNPKLVWDLTIPGPGEMYGSVALPHHSLSVLSYQCLTLTALFGMVVAFGNRLRTVSRRSVNDRRSGCEEYQEAILV